MKYITVTLNPALDMNIALSGPLMTEGLNRSVGAAFSPGGKGINVSRTLRALGCDSDAICILGGFTGAKVKQMLMSEGVSVRAISSTADTRVNISIMSPDYTFSGKQCEINNPPVRGEEGALDKDFLAGKNAGIRPAEETAEILKKVNILLQKLLDQNGAENTAVIFAGSIPPDMPQNTYAALIRYCRERGALTVCDCDGDALRYALAARPDYIKPNLDELTQLSERRILKDPIGVAASEISVTTACETTVLATAGALGAYLVKGHDIKHVASVPVERVLTPKGAGDSFLAAYLYAKYDCGMDEKKSLAAAARVASKKIATEGGRYPDLTAAV